MRNDPKIPHVCETVGGDLYGEAGTPGTVGTVTVTCKNSWYRLSFSKLPGQEFGPYRFADAIHELRFSALMSAVAARGLVMEATTEGTATDEVDRP